MTIEEETLISQAKIISNQAILLANIEAIVRDKQMNAVTQITCIGLLFGIGRGVEENVGTVSAL